MRRVDCHGCRNAVYIGQLVFCIKHIMRVNLNCPYRYEFDDDDSALRELAEKIAVMFKGERGKQ